MASGPLQELKATTDTKDEVPPGYVTNAPPPPPTEGASSSSRPTSFMQRLASKENRNVAKKFFSAYAQAWVGMNPLWLMGEAVTGKKVGSQFTKGKNQLFEAVEEIRKAVASNSDDVVVILDEKMREGKQQTGRAAEIIRAAGEHAILVVTESMEKLKANSETYKKQLGPEVKRAVAKNGRDVIVIIDKALKNPIVVTGVTQFARTQRIPHADALLRLASLGLSRILREIPEVQDLAEGAIHEMDAAELERSSTEAEVAQARKVEEETKGDIPKVETTTQKGKDPYAEMRKKNDCVVM